ncbi:MAG: trigger factor [Candidatus Omnitrophota bacterium]
MKVAIKKLDALKRELNFEVSKERVSKKIEEVFKDITREAKVKGFRPGKAPRHVIESEYGGLAKEEAIKKIIPEVYQEALEKESISPLDYPEIGAVEFKDGILKFTAGIEVKPEVKVTNYKGIAVTRKSSAVTDEELAKTLEYFQKGQSKEGEKTEINDDFVKGLGYPNLDTFKDSLKRQMEIDKDRQNRMDVERQITDVLVKNAKLTVPQSLVQKQQEYRLSDLKRRLKSQGLPDEEIEKRANEMTKDMKELVERDVKLFLIFDKIAEDEKIQVKQGENVPAKVMEFLMKEAQWQDEKIK